MGSPDGPRTPSPPPERGRSVRAADRVGLRTQTRFDLTRFKTLRARKLRRNATDVEAIMWSKLRGGRLDGLGFRRQHAAGPYTLDFFCPEIRLAIELDGGQHGEEPQQRSDHERTAWLRSRGVTVLRFWNNDVTQNLRGVLERIKTTAEELRIRDMSPTRPPALRWRSALAADLPLSGGGDSKRDGGDPS